MLPYDALTEVDKTTIQYYLQIYGSVHSAPLPQVLGAWNKNKIKLFKAFGQRLRVEKSISIPKDVKAMNRQLSAIYKEYPIYYLHDIAAAKNNKEAIKERVNNDFIADVLHYWVNQDYRTEELYILSRLFCLSNVSRGYIDTISAPGEFQFISFKATVKNGMKTLRTIQKLLKLTHYPHMDLFDEWRNAVNCISIGNEIRAKLVLSIHPIDFMSMSDNTCNWSSCMSWKKTGCYRSGTIEMMNSNVAVIAYLEAPPTFKLEISEDESYLIPNKSWRSLFYVHKNIILSGKPYPYHNEELTFEVLHMLKDLVKENLNWDYQFGIQEYQDMDNLDGNYYVRDFFNVDYDRNHEHHCIFVYTNSMYNDIIESHSAYYCYRNKVPHSIKLCLSGPLTCICCGDVIMRREDIYDYDTVGSDLICGECGYSHRCSKCGEIHYHMKYHTAFGRFCSDECCNDYFYFPKLGQAFSKEDLVEPFSDMVIIADENFTIQQGKDLEYEFGKLESREEFDNFYQRAKEQYGKTANIQKLNSYVRSYVIPYNCTADQKTRAYNKSVWKYVRLQIFRYGEDEARNQRIREIEERMDDLKTRIPLLDYLKGG